MKSIPYIIIGALVGVIIFMRACGPPPASVEPEIVTEIDTLWRDSIIKVPEYVPKIVKKDSLIKVPQDVDTAAILKDYFAALHYKDTIWIDTIGYVAIHDVISENKLASRNVVKSYSIPTIYQKTTITLPPELKTKVFAGLQLSGPVLSIGPEITLLTKQDAMYKLGGGISSAGPYVSVGTSWKIKLK